MTKYLREIVIIVLLIILFFSYRSCQNHINNEISSESYQAALKDSLHHYINKSGDTITYKKAAEVNTDELNKIVSQNKDLRAQVKYYSNVKSVTTLQTVTKFDTIFIPLDSNLPADFSPVSFTLDSSYISIHGVISNAGILLDSLVIPNKQTIITGEKKNGLFKANEFVVSIENSNKYMKVTGLNNITIKENKHWYSSGWLKVGIGTIFGFYIAKKI